jgi:uncharacterized protein YceK
MRRSFVVLAWTLVLSACGVAVRPLDTGHRGDTGIDGVVALDVVAEDSSSDSLIVDRPDTQSVVLDTGLPSNDASRDVVDTGVPRGNECDERYILASCRRFYHIGEGDLGARFSCCNGYCESGDCTRRSPGGIALCGRTPCDIRAGQICCPGVAGAAYCFPRDRNLCP